MAASSAPISYSRKLNDTFFRMPAPASTARLAIRKSPRHYGADYLFLIAAVLPASHQRCSSMVMVVPS